jgi:hypothetical protein
MRRLRLAAFASLSLAAACGSSDGDGGGDTLLTARFDDGSRESVLEEPCRVTLREDGFSFVASDDEEFGIETVWESAVVDGPGTYDSELLAGVVVFAMFPDPDDPSTPTFRDAEGWVEFAAYDPPAQVAGSFEVTVKGALPDDPPRYQIAGTFDCAE